MSREVLGLAPDEPLDAVEPALDLLAPDARAPHRHEALSSTSDTFDTADVADVTDPSSGTAGRTTAGASAGRSARQVAVLVIAALALGAVLGWTTTGSFGSLDRDSPDGAVPLDASATIVDVLSSTVEGVRGTAEARLRVTNTGDVPLTVIGADKAFSAGTVESLSPNPLVVDAGEALDVDLRIAVTCDSTQRLSLPPLTVRRQDGALRSLDVHGASATLAGLCQRGDDRGHLLFVTGVTRDDDGRLRITVAVPNGRTVHLSGISIGGTTLTGTPLPVTLDTPEKVIWLDPPSACAPAWQGQGIPEQFDLTIEALGDTGPTHVLQPGGLVLADWLLGAVCRGAA